MTTPAQLLESQTHELIANRYPYWVRITRNFRDAEKWCAEQFGPDLLVMDGTLDADYNIAGRLFREWNFSQELTDRVGWTFYENTFYFLHEVNAMHFKMRWHV